MSSEEKCAKPNQKIKKDKSSDSATSGSSWFSWGRHSSNRSQSSKSGSKISVPTVVFNAATDTPGGSEGNIGDGAGERYENSEGAPPQRLNSQQLGQRSRSNSCIKSRGNSRTEMRYNSIPEIEKDNPTGPIYPKSNTTSASVKLKMTKRGNANNSTNSSSVEHNTSGSRRKSWAREALNTIYSLNPPPRTISAEMDGDFGGSKSALNNYKNSISMPRSCSNTVSSPSVENKNKRSWGAGSLNLNLDDFGGFSQVVMEAIPKSDGQVSEMIK